MPFAMRELTLEAAGAGKPVVAKAAAKAPAAPSPGRVDAATLITIPHGTFGGIAYQRYEAMFAGVTPGGHPYRVPCQVIAPAPGQSRSGLLLFDWLNTAGIGLGLAGAADFAIARFFLTDDFLFSQGLTYATVRGGAIAIGVKWSDGQLNTSTESIESAADEFEIVADFVKALQADPLAAQLVGDVRRRASFGYSESGGDLRGFLRLDVGQGAFDFSLVGGCGSGYNFPAGDKIKSTNEEVPPLAGAGLEIDFNTEAEVVHPWMLAAEARHIDPNYRVYEFAGCSHVRNVDVAAFGLADPEKANPADWYGFVRALFAAGKAWCDGVEPPPSIWLGAPRSPQIARDAKENALVRYVGGQAVNTSGYRLPEVAVGENRYIAVDFSYRDGSLLGFVRSLCGGFVDLTGTFTSHSDYVKQITDHARTLQGQGYLLKEDADAIIGEASQSAIGQ